MLARTAQAAAQRWAAAAAAGSTRAFAAAAADGPKSNQFPPPDASRLGTADLCDVHHPEPVDVVSQPKIQIMQAGGVVAGGGGGGSMRACVDGARERACTQVATSPVPQPRFLLVQPLFRDYGGHLRFRGRAATVKCFEARRWGGGTVPSDVSCRLQGGLALPHTQLFHRLLAARCWRRAVQREQGSPGTHACPGALTGCFHARSPCRLTHWCVPRWRSRARAACWWSTAAPPCGGCCCRGKGIHLQPPACAAACRWVWPSPAAQRHVATGPGRPPPALQVRAAGRQHCRHGAPKRVERHHHQRLHPGQRGGWGGAGGAAGWQLLCRTE